MRLPVFIAEWLFYQRSFGEFLFLSIGVLFLLALLWFLGSQIGQYLTKP